MAARHDEIRHAGGAVLGIGPAAGCQALHLTESGAVPYPLLLDPDHQIAGAIELGRQPLLRFLFHARAWWNWSATVFRTGQGTITGAYWEVPGIVVLDPMARAVWVHRGRFLGDYPPIDETVRRLKSAIEDRG